MYYRYSQKWLDLFEEQPLMIRVETGHYIKALHNLLNAHFDLRNHAKFEAVLRKFEEFSQTDRVIENDNFRIQSFVYITTARINQVFMLGTFKEGIADGPRDRTTTGGIRPLYRPAPHPRTELQDRLPLFRRRRLRYLYRLSSSGSSTTSKTSAMTSNAMPASCT